MLTYDEKCGGLAASASCKVNITPDARDGGQLLRTIQTDLKANESTARIREQGAAMHPARSLWHCSNNIGRSLEAFHTNHNVVNIERIRRGIDVRTTVSQ